MHLGKKCMINLKGDDDFTRFFNGQYAYIVDEIEEGIKVTPILAPKCTLLLMYGEIIVF